MGNFARMMQSTAHDTEPKTSMDVQRQAQIISPKDCDSKGNIQKPDEPGEKPRKKHSGKHWDKGTKVTRQTGKRQKAAHTPELFI